MSIESEEETFTARSSSSATPAGDIYVYSREEMMRLREAPLSRARPDYLAVDFDG